MIAFTLAALLLWPVPPMIPTLGSGTPYHAPAASVTQTTLPTTGWATFYNPGVFERVLKVRGLTADGCPDCIGYAALLWPGDMGRTVCINGYGPLWVVDVAANHHRPGLIAKGWIVDIDPDSWQVLNYPNAPTLTTVSEC